MRDVIQKVLATEADARRMVEAARVEAQRLISEAQQKGQDLLASARQEVRDEAEKLVEVAIKAAEREKRARLACIATEIETQVQLDRTTRQRAVEAVIRCVSGGG
jgi:vacuolar-type H+-ATPase subunit H